MYLDHRAGPQWVTGPSSAEWSVHGGIRFIFHECEQKRRSSSAVTEELNSHMTSECVVCKMGPDAFF